VRRVRSYNGYMYTLYRSLHTTASDTTKQCRSTSVQPGHMHSSYQLVLLSLVSLMAGLALGLAVAWIVWPVAYVDAAPVDLHVSYRDLYLQLVAEQYSHTRSLELARAELGVERERWSAEQIAVELRRLAHSSPAKQDVLEALAMDLERGYPAAILASETKVTKLSSPLPALLAPALVLAGAASTSPLPTPTAEPLAGQGGQEPVVSEVITPTAEALPVEAPGTPGFRWPAEGRLTQGYGWWHPGIDIAAYTGAPIYAADSGVVSFAGWSTIGYGYLVTITHANGYTTYYAHLYALYVSAGQHVEAGQLIAAMGSTGNSSGPHLHFEIRSNNVPLDPKTLLP
jgi:murein DD-endopeptidase MepM/ murein hydrolase activator NlpD